MRPRPNLRWIGLAAGAILLVVAAIVLVHPRGDRSSVSTSRQRPNVLLVSVDTLRADYLGAYGGIEARTPALDELARGGVLFEHAVSHVALTLPAHASLFTSRIPPEHGVRDNATFRLSESETSLGEVFRQSGYRTAAFVGAFVLDSRFGLDQGFELYDNVERISGDAERRADAVLHAATNWLDDIGTSQPWFTFVHLFDPHTP